MKDPLLSVCLITYNHSKYIKTAIDSILMQNINFSWELIIADDFSIDGTREILAKYKEEHPNLIKLILQEKNVGAAQNWIDLITTPNSKYIAYFEGDDYWIDPNKLQKQVDFLETHPEFSLCFHNSIIIWEDKKIPPRFFCEPPPKEISTIEDVIEEWFIPSSSMVFRTEYIRPFPDYISNNSSGDYALILLLSYNGLIKYIDEVMSVYRRASGSFSYDQNRTNEFVMNNVVKLLVSFNIATESNYNYLIAKRIKLINTQIKSYNLKINHPTIFHINHPILTIGKILRDLGLFIISKKMKIDG